MRRFILLFLLLASLGVGGWFYFRQPPPHNSPQQLDIYFTCDTRGRIEPCGCFSGQMGGVTRVSTVIKNAPAGAIKFEVGDSIAGNQDFQVLQYTHLLEALGQVGYHAVNLGRREVSLKAEQIEALSSASPVPMLSTNVFHSVKDQPLVRPWLVLKQNGVRIGVVGVVDPTTAKETLGTNVSVKGMSESIRQVLPELKKQADVLICLAFTDQSGMEALAKEFYEIPLILGGDVRQPSTSLARVNQSHLYATTNEGRALAEIHAIFDPAKQGLQEVRGDIHLMDPMIPQDPAIAAHATSYRKEVRNKDLSVDHPEGNDGDRVPGVKSSATYVGSQSCAACHAQSFAQWSKSKHAHAFQSLVRRESDADPACISCHVTGFGETSGYLRTTKLAALENVGCESCHGPASDHVAERTKHPTGADVFVKMRPVGSGQCIQCHHGEFSRPFKYEDFWPLISHGKESGASR